MGTIPCLCRGIGAERAFRIRPERSRGRFMMPVNVERMVNTLANSALRVGLFAIWLANATRSAGLHLRDTQIPSIMVVRP
jgi:hypothetical protein